MDNSIFISGLNRDQRSKLVPLGCVDFSIGSTHGVLFDGAKLPSVLQLLGCSAQNSRPTSYEGVIQVTLSFAGKSGAAAPAASAGSPAITELFRQVEALQGLATLTSADRELRERLTASVHEKDAALRTASEQLRTDAGKLKDLRAHVTGIKAHNLSTDLTNPLDKVVTDRTEALEALRGTVSTLAKELGEAQAALQAEVTKRRLSPEEALSAATSALRDADAANSAASAVVPVSDSEGAGHTDEA